MREFYEKLPDGSFRSIGLEFSGFPANGIWRVVDGHQNCIIQLSDDPNPPIPQLDVALFSLADDILNTLPYPCSTHDVIMHTLTAVARTQPQTYPELSL